MENEKFFYRMKDLLELFPVCKATIYKRVKENKFPKPIKNGRCSFWRADEIKAYCENLQ